MTDKTYIMTDYYFKHQLKQIVQPLTGDKRDYDAGIKLINKLIADGQIIEDLYSHYVGIVKDYVGVE